jgi:uncharacterized membrane protein
MIKFPDEKVNQEIGHYMSMLVNIARTTTFVDGQGNGKWKCDHCRGTIEKEDAAFAILYTNLDATDHITHLRIDTLCAVCVVELEFNVTVPNKQES